MKSLVIAIVATLSLQAGVVAYGAENSHATERPSYDDIFQEGADSGVHDLCQELGFTPDNEGGCDTNL